MDDPDQTQPMILSGPIGDVRMSDSRIADLLDVGLESTSGQQSRKHHAWTPPGIEELQRMLPQYEIREFIARGAMGAVYKGVQSTLKRIVAIKVLPPEIEDGDLQFAARFKHEAQAMAHLSHPNIVAVFDAGETAGGLLYFVMEFIEGTDVAQYIASVGIVEPQRAMQITTAVCDALAFAHEEGIIHRDIKPSNIIIDQRGRVKVADFGLAKTINTGSALLTQSSVAMGTPDFIAPESFILDIKVDQRADIYAVGVMLYQMLTGRIPRGRFEMPSEMVEEMDPRLDDIVDKAMKTDREMRYSTAVEMMRDVEQIVRTPYPLAEVGRGFALVPMSSPLSRQDEKQRMSRSRVILLIAAVFFAAAAVAVAVMSKPGGGIATDVTFPTSEPAAIKLWDSPEKIYLGNGIAWEENVLRLDERGLVMDKPVSRDVILRASVRGGPTADYLNFSVRAQPKDSLQAVQSISAVVNYLHNRIAIRAKRGDQYYTLVSWVLPEACGRDEWMRVEVRAVGDEFSVSVDGKDLGIVHDRQLLEPGGVAITSIGGSGYFKDIEYVPLDGNTSRETKPR